MKVSLRMFFLSLAIAVVLSTAATSTVYATRLNVADSAETANECVSMTWVKKTTARIISGPGDYDYWQYTVYNTCPYTILFHWCFFRAVNNTCGTRRAYYEKARFINGFRKYVFNDPNPFKIWPADKNTLRLQWLACVRNGFGFSRPGRWRDVKSCRM